MKTHENHNTSKHAKLPHDSGENFLTPKRVNREAARLRRLYKRWTKGKSGPRPDGTVFCLQAVRRLSTMKNGKSKRIFPPFDPNDLKKVYRSRAYKEVCWAANWEDLRRGQKAFEQIKRKKRGETGREIQRKLTISKDTFGKLPKPSPFLRKVRAGKSWKFVFDPPCSR